jgi:hypothetical protein
MIAYKFSRLKNGRILPSSIKNGQKLTAKKNHQL